MVFFIQPISDAQYVKDRTIFELLNGYRCEMNIISHELMRKVADEDIESTRDQIEKLILYPLYVR